jgi:hypothetical protein
MRKIFLETWIDFRKAAGLRTLAGILTVVAPVLVSLQISDNATTILLPGKPIPDTLRLNVVSFITNEPTFASQVADWSGKINFISASIALWIFGSVILCHTTYVAYRYLSGDGWRIKALLGLFFASLHYGPG